MGFLEERLAKKKARLNQIDEILDAFAKNGHIQSYTIDTGQDRQTVGRESVEALAAERRRLEIEILEIEAAFGARRGARQVVPWF